MPPLEQVWLGRVPYGRAWEMQRRAAAARSRGAIPDLLLLLEHPPVYTMGRQGEAAHLGAGVESLRARGAEYVEVDRGGSVTFHGPGQLVAYPILDLAEAFPLRGQPGLGDVLAHVRTLEQALIDTVSTWGVEAARKPPYTGVWVGEEKLAAIGVKLASGVTTHGAALNVSTDLGWFGHVIPCGISGKGVTSLEALGVRRLPAVAEVGACLAAALARLLGRESHLASATSLTVLRAVAAACPQVG